jgi:hypothetical protein
MVEITDAGNGARDVEESVAAMEPVGLEVLVDFADLQERYDVKYLVPVPALRSMLERVGARMRVLEVEGARSTPYHSVYFDTPGLGCYRAHLQRRRRRFKVRTRHYGDPSEAVLEVKTKGVRGRTVKDRTEHTAARPDVLDPAAERFVAGVLARRYDVALPERLEARVVTSYRRTTLVDLDSRERVTIDRRLRASVGAARIELLDRHAIVECKSTEVRSATVRALLGLGLRATSVSKYCLSVAATRADLPGNPWVPVLRELQRP